MSNLYYFDTSIWLDFFEKRNEPNFPKTERAKKLIIKIALEQGKIILSEVVLNEMLGLGYSRYELEEKFSHLFYLITRVSSTKKQFGKAKDLSHKRNIPIRDALHALTARDYKAIMVTRDKHYDKLLDITKYKKPEEII